jgi:hypothetical protein
VSPLLSSPPLSSPLLPSPLRPSFSLSLPLSPSLSLSLPLSPSLSLSLPLSPSLSLSLPLSHLVLLRLCCTCRFTFPVWLPWILQDDELLKLIMQCVTRFEASTGNMATLKELKAESKHALDTGDVRSRECHTCWALLPPPHTALYNPCRYRCRCRPPTLSLSLSPGRGNHAPLRRVRGRR